MCFSSLSGENGKSMSINQVLCVTFASLKEPQAAQHKTEEKKYCFMNHFMNFNFFILFKDLRKIIKIIKCH